MDRHYKAGAIEAPPSGADASSGSYPTAGNPATSTPATKPGPYWFYMITESLRNVIVAAGLAPDRLNLNLLKDAIVTLIANAVQNALTPTSQTAYFMRQSAPTGWVRLGGGTIGNAASGASERAHADCHNLFVILWNGYPNSIIPVVGGRGASAEADWSANKRLTLVDDQGIYDRAWDYTGAVNPGQGFGVYLADAMQGHGHSNTRYNTTGGGGQSLGAGGTPGGLVTMTDTISNGVHGDPRLASETRVKSRTSLKCVKL